LLLFNKHSRLLIPKKGNATNQYFADKVAAEFFNTIGGKRTIPIRHGMTTFAPDSGLMVSCEHRSSSLSGSPPIAILKAGSDLISSQSLPSG
jgi:hypothetical protein